MKFYNKICLLVLGFILTYTFAEETEKKDDIPKPEAAAKKNVIEYAFPEKAYIAQLKYGDKCPPADPDHPYEVDEKITRIDFHTNSVVLDIGPELDVQNYTVSQVCSPYFYVKYTEGYRFAIESYDFRGSVHTDKDIRAVVKSGNTDALTHVFEGPTIGTFDTRDSLDWGGWNKPIHGTFAGGKLWFGCGTGMVRINVSVEALLNNRKNEKGRGSLVLKDFSANIVWAKCPPKKKRYIPTQEEMVRSSIPQPPKKTQEQIEKEKKKFSDAKRVIEKQNEKFNKKDTKATKATQQVNN